MKKIFLCFMMAIIGVAGNYGYAKSWRVNCNTNAKADYANVWEAMADEKIVRAGDTLYLEAGHVEGSITLSKKLHLIGPGYWNEGVPSNVSYSSSAVINGTLYFTVDGSSITGCVISDMGVGRNDFNYVSNLKIERCLILGSISLQNAYYRSNVTITNCFVKGNVSLPSASKLIGNIITKDTDDLLRMGAGSSIVNNVIIGNTGNIDSNVVNTSNIFTSTITNNIIINTTTHNQYFVDADSTHYYRNNAMSFDSSKGNNISNNILSTEAKYLNQDYRNNYFIGATLDNIFTRSGTEEEQYELKSGSPAIGAGIGGVDCGAYGGLRPYIKGGYPQLIPVIYDVQIPNNPSDGKLPVKLKIRTQND